MSLNSTIDCILKIEELQLRQTAMGTFCKAVRDNGLSVTDLKRISDGKDMRAVCAADLLHEAGVKYEGRK